MTSTPEDAIERELRHLAKIGDELKEERDFIIAGIGKDIIRSVERVRDGLSPHDPSDAHKQAAQRWKGLG